MGLFGFRRAHGVSGFTGYIGGLQGLLWAEKGLIIGLVDVYWGLGFEPVSVLRLYFLLFVSFHGPSVQCLGQYWV